ncbi:hypothetical protein ES703_26256 [subsurface metagenome]
MDKGRTEKFHPSPTMQVHFGRGRVIAMNRKERRRQHLYGDRITMKKRQPSPPPIFHSLEEARDSQL